MKNFLFLLLLFAQPATAQPQFRLGANAAALRTHLYNANDNASGAVESSPQITPNGGFTLSWVNTDKSGFQGLQTGITYLGYKQTTSGESKDGRDPVKPKADTRSQLHYLSLPIEARFGLAQRGRFTPFVTVGVYASRLISYTEYSHVQLYVSAQSDYVHQYTTISNKDASFEAEYQNIALGGNLKSKLKKGIYEPWNYGALASIGADFDIGYRSFLSVRIPVRYSFTDAERKEPLVYEDNQKALQNLQEHYYWDYNTPKGLFNRLVPVTSWQGGRIISNDLPKRGPTHAFSYGLEISYGFKLIPKKRY